MRGFLFIAYCLSADLVDYDGKTLTFSDHFQIEHPLGNLSGEKAMLTNLQIPLNREQTSKTESNSRIQIRLENQVFLQSCNTERPFSISSDKARCDLPPKNIFSTLQFQEIEFFEKVKIQTRFDAQSDIIATGGSAIYKQGQITLYPAPPKSHCQIERNKDWIHAEKILFDLAQMEMICLCPRGYFSEKALFFAADSARFSLSKNFQPVLLVLEGHVELNAIYQNKKSFALADAVTYKVKENELLLTAAPSARVLFWQEGLELSAPQLRITDAIEGIGDIHFVLDKAEKNQLQQIFSRHL